MRGPIARCALLLIDVQQGFKIMEQEGRSRNNANAEAHIARLLAAFRGVGARVIHVRHASLEPASLFRQGQPGFEAQDFARERAGEPVLLKTVNSAFIGTDLEERLRTGGIDSLVVAGATTNHCVETTLRMAANLGFDAQLVSDASWTFDLVGVHGESYPAELVHALSLANVHGEFGEVVTTAQVLAALAVAQDA